MAEQGDRAGQRRVRRRQARTTVDEQLGQHDISIAALGASHRAGALDQSSQLFAASHLHMAREWPVRCPLFMHGLGVVGLESLRYLQFIRLDINLITALVERWCPSTNTFHLPVGEMTITLQDVQVITGLKIDGEPFVGQRHVGSGCRWPTWKDCCLELLGNYPDPNITYHAPDDDDSHATFTMGANQLNSLMPLRWLRWVFYRQSYTDLDEQSFMQHTRAYCLYMIGCLLLPDTSGSHVPLQFLPLLEDLVSFSEMSIGGAVLAHLYRELCLATNPTRVYIAGCLPLLQVWCWERISIGRPTMSPPAPEDINDRPLARRWYGDMPRALPIGNALRYRDEFDGLRHSQVIMTPYSDDLLNVLHPLCREGSEICTARVPLISYKRVEWHLADRVMRQFGGVQSINIEPIDRNFRRIDGRGRADVNWTQYHHADISLWLSRQQFITPIIPPTGNGREELRIYLSWYKSWASLYLLHPTRQRPDTVHQRSTTDRQVMEYITRSRSIAQQFSGQHGESQSSMQQGFNEILELSSRLEDSLFIDYAMSDAHRDAHRGHEEQQHPRRSTYDSSRRSFASSSHTTAHEPPRHSMYVGSSHHGMTGTFEVGQSSQQWSTYLQESEPQPATVMQIPNWMAPLGVPSSPTQQDMLFQQAQAAEVQMDDEGQHHQRERRAPNRYTPGSAAIPRRRRS